MNIQVFVHPGSRAPRVEKDLFGKLHIYVAEPPLQGRANKAVVLALAEYFKIKSYQIELLRGEKSRQKIFRVANE